MTNGEAISLIAHADNKVFAFAMKQLRAEETRRIDKLLKEEEEQRNREDFRSEFLAFVDKWSMDNSMETLKDADLPMTFAALDAMFEILTARTEERNRCGS